MVRPACSYGESIIFIYIKQHYVFSRKEKIIILTDLILMLI